MEEYSEEDYSYEDYSDEDDYSEESEESEESVEARSEPINVADLINANGRSMKKDRKVKNFAPLECGAVDTLNYGEFAVIYSHSKFGYRRYPNNLDCSWTLNIPASSQIYFSCEYFHVKKGDYLFIEEQAYYGYAPEGFGFSAGSPETAVELNLRFKTNAERRGWGFLCYIDSEPKNFTTAAPTTTTTLQPGQTTTTIATTQSPTSSCNCGIANTANRIVGGVETEENEYPWQVGLVSASGTRPWCGGTLISDRHVLTAAHCTAGGSTNSIAVLVGEHRTDDNQYTRVRLSAITDHPNYNSNTLNNDYSILTLAEPVTFSDAVRPACLPSSTAGDFAGQLATVSGWGTLSSGGNQPTVLNEVQVTVQSNTQCNNAYGGGITGRMICAADAGKDSCQGDSGGPLVAQENSRWSLIGVVSWGYGCADPSYPGVYARVTSVLDWIQSNTSGTQQSSCGLNG